MCHSALNRQNSRAADVVTPRKPRSSEPRVRLKPETPGAPPMKCVGIREAKAKLSELARAAAAGQPTLLTDYGKPLAVIAAMAEDFSCGEAPATPVEIAPQRSDF